MTTSDTGSVAASGITNLDSETSGVVTVQAGITTLTGTIAQAQAAFDANDAGTVTGLDDTEAVTTSDTGTVAASDITDLDGETSGVVTVQAGITTLTGTIAQAQAAFDANDAGTVTGLDDTEAVTTSDTTAAASSLNLLNVETAGVINAASITTLTGSLSDVQASYTANTAGTISGLGNEAVTLSDTGSAVASGITTLAGDTSGTVTVNAGITTLTGTIAQAQAVYDAANISIDGDEAVTTSDTGTVAASDITDLDGETSGVVTVQAGITTLTGTIAQAQAAFDANDAGTVTGLDDTEAVTTSDTGTVAASDITDLDGETSGVVTVQAGITTLTGTIAQAQAAFDANDAGTVTGLDDTEAVTTSDTGTVAASDITDLDGETSGVVTVQAGITTLTGTIAEAQAAFDANDAGTVAGLDDTEAVTTSDTTAAASSLNLLNVETAGVINAASITTLTGSLSDVQASYTANTAGTISGLGNEAVTLSDTGSAVASGITTLAGDTSGTVTVNAV